MSRGWIALLVLTMIGGAVLPAAILPTPAPAQDQQAAPGQPAAGQPPPPDRQAAPSQQAAQPPAPGATVVQPAPVPGLPFDQIPFYADWASSPHANHAAQAFNHWNSAGSIPTDCARCHSTPGFRDFLGADGTPAGVVDHPAPIGTVITCLACHNAPAMALHSVTFPSGKMVDGLGPSARCMACHQGRGSTQSVNAAVAGMDEDTVQPKLSFIDAHYAAAAATMMGSLAEVAYQYPGKDYFGRRVHPLPYDTCAGCHETHTVSVKVNACAACHAGVTDAASLKTIRISTADYDGSGNANEGVAQEIADLEGKLLAAIQSYAGTVAGKPLGFSGDAYPYFFADTNGNGTIDSGEATVPNAYKSWTPRLLKAAYNYLYFVKDPGAYAHNPVYTVEILHDSIADLGSKVPTDLGQAVRP